MPLRAPEFQRLLTLAQAAVCQRSAPGSAERGIADRMFAALQEPSTRSAEPTPMRLPVCRHLPAALDQARRQPAPVGPLADAFAAIEPQLGWAVRPGAEAVGEPFLSGHANAAIAGPEGLELRGDVRIGVSLMAPDTRYPNHRHPPEELYIVLSGGEWRQADGPWHAPGIGGLVHNPPNVVHAMRSMESPLLALWFLWTGETAA